MEGVCQVDGSEVAGVTTSLYSLRKKAPVSPKKGKMGFVGKGR